VSSDNDRDATTCAYRYRFPILATRHIGASVAPGLRHLGDALAHVLLLTPRCLSEHRPRRGTRVSDPGAW